MSDTHPHDDAPRHLHRRAFLKGGAVSLLTLGFAGGGPLFLHRAAHGSTARRKVLVTVFQRGAMDGLAAVPPIGDRHLAKLRPRLTLDATRSGSLLDLGNGFGLHPAFQPLASHFSSGDLAIVHGVGSPDPTRSHFDAQDFMESGTPGDKGTPSGWLNRVVGELGHEAKARTPFQAVAMTSTLPKSLYGDASALAVERLEDFRLSRSEGKGFESLYREAAQRELRATGSETFAAESELRQLSVENYRPANGAVYPRSPLGRSLQQVAMLIKEGVGLEVAFTESGGWDTHVRQGAAAGPFAQRATDLARSIDAFWKDLGRRRDDVVLLTMTEFGRTVAENGSGGTDHGHGSCLFVLGSEVQGGQVHGSLPTLARENLYEGRDLPVTTDFRSVFSSVAIDHLGVAPDATLFPGWKGSPLPLLRRG
ncbi:MAG: DUF1501 domain-containing protein [Acidobacteriota bacterium]